MAFLASLLPEPGVETDEAVKALSVANADRCFVAMSRKRPRSSLEDDNTDNKDTYNTVHMIFAQPSDSIGRPIELTKSEIEIETATANVMKRLSVPVISPSTGPLLIPIATVDDDNEQLVFDRPGVPVCSRGKDCIAHMIDGPPTKPLNAYRGVGHDPDVNDACSAYDIIWE